MAKYYGNREILGIKDTDQEGYKAVELEQGKSIILSEKLLTAASTDEPIDLTALREKECMPVANEIIKLFGEYGTSIQDKAKLEEMVGKILFLLHQWNIKIVDIDYLFNSIILDEWRQAAGLIQESLNYSFDRATEILYQGIGKYTRRMHDVHNILAPEMQKNDNASQEDPESSSLGNGESI